MADKAPVWPEYRAYFGAPIAYLPEVCINIRAPDIDIAANAGEYMAEKLDMKFLYVEEV